MRITKHRQEILDVLAQGHSTMSAADIHDLIPHINLVTIYRNLELFVEDNLIKKLHLDSKEAVYEYQSHPHYHAVCNNCDKVIHFEIAPNRLQKLVDIPNFFASEIEIVVRGTCGHKHQTK